MEVLSVDLPSHLSSSPPSHSQQEIALGIKNAYNLAINMQDGAKQLLADYVSPQNLREMNIFLEARKTSIQGEPFTNAGFNPPVEPFPGLPSPSLPPSAWLDLSDAERLQQNVTAFSNLPVFLSAVKSQQEEMNSNASDLHHQLTLSRLQCLGLSNHLASIMASMGLVPAPATPAEPPGLGSSFFMKFSGYRVCHLYRDWVLRCVKDLSLLADRYPVPLL
uniref:cardiotrophin-2-like isoform X1 n=1 Tax=Podarcis muralis TaxID=64176 RepID=UPI00109F4243|nr:cardiotrophin-2-like isoform X1 [Podarcis muralis]